MNEYVSYSIYTLSVLCILTHTRTHTHTTLSSIVLVKVICSHIHYLELQNGNKQKDRVQNSLYNTALNEVLIVCCFSALLPILAKCGKYTTDKDVERTHLIASHHSLKALLKVEHTVSKYKELSCYTVYSIYYSSLVIIKALHLRHCKNQQSLQQA